MFGGFVALATVVGLYFGWLMDERQRENAWARVVLSRYALVAASTLVAFTTAEQRILHGGLSSGLTDPGQIAAIAIIAANLASAIVEARRLIRREIEREDKDESK